MNKNIVTLLLLWTCFGLGAQAQTPIGTAAELLAMATNGNYYLTSDITVDNWVAKGPFSGTFDGRGYCINLSSITADASGNVGLFSVTNNAVISNLVVTGWFRGDATICGGIAGRAIQTTIQNCETSMVFITADQTALLGGVVGVLESGELKNSSSNSTLEGYLIGGLVGSVSSGAAVRNCYCNNSFVIVRENETETGGLVHENRGIVENCYLKMRDEGWYLPSIGQLALMAGMKCFFMDKNVQWPDNLVITSSMPRDGYLYCLDKNHRTIARGFENFMSGTQGVVRCVHDVYGTGYNIGDVISVGGVRSIVFSLNDDGYGAMVFPAQNKTIKYTSFTTRDNTSTSDFYMNQSYMYATNAEYAMSYDGHVVDGSVVNTIPASYDHNLGKYLTRTLQENDNTTTTQIKLLKPKGSEYTANPALKQLAYTNIGQMRNCYYPESSSTFPLFGTGSAEKCDRYSESNGPYNYGEYGSRIYVGSDIGPVALRDTLNAWVDSHGTENYCKWTIAGTTDFNDNQPFLKYQFSNGSKVVNTAASTTVHEHEILRYVHLDNLPNTYVVNRKILAYYGNLDNVAADNVTSSWSSSLYFTDDASLKGSFHLKGNAGVAFDNSDASGFAGGNYDWHMLSSPFSNAPIGISYTGYVHVGPTGTPKKVSFSLADAYYPTDTPYASWDFYTYHEPTCGWLNFKRNTGDHYNPFTGAAISYTNETNHIPGKGYMCAIDKKTILQANGTLNNNDVEIMLSKTGELYPGYNLVGNPYLAYLDFDAFSNANASILEQQAYTLFDADRQGYISYCTGASDNPAYAPRYLHPHQGFFVEAARDNVKLVFKTNQTVVTPLSDFREPQRNYPIVNLTLTDEEGRRDYATVEVDRPETGGMLKMKGITNCQAELSIGNASNEYSIAFVEQHPDHLPLRLAVMQDGTFTLSWSTYHADFGYLHLIDHITGTDVDCLKEKEYTFLATTQDFRSRFRLVFGHQGVDETAIDAEEATFAQISNGMLMLAGQGLLEVFDVCGRKLYSTRLHSELTSLKLPQLAQGLYVLRLTTSNGVKTQKLIIT